MRSLCRRTARLEECAREADEDCLVLVVTSAGMPVDPEDVRRYVEANSQPGQRCMLVDFTRAVVIIRGEYQNRAVGTVPAVMPGVTDWKGTAQYTSVVTMLSALRAKPGVRCPRGVHESRSFEPRYKNLDAISPGRMQITAIAVIIHPGAMLRMCKISSENSPTRHACGRAVEHEAAAQEDASHEELCANGLSDRRKPRRWPESRSCPCQLSWLISDIRPCMNNAGLKLVLPLP
jgi:hypothetical protein